MEKKHFKWRRRNLVSLCLSLDFHSVSNDAFVVLYHKLEIKVNLNLQLRVDHSTVYTLSF